MVEKRRQVPATDVTIFIDRRGEHRAAMVSNPRGIVRATTEKRDAKGSPADNHAHVPFGTTLVSHVRILPRLEDRVAFHQFPNTSLDRPIGPIAGGKYACIGYDIVAFIRIFSDRRFKIDEPGHNLLD